MVFIGFGCDGLNATHSYGHSSDPHLKIEDLPFGNDASLVLCDEAEIGRHRRAAFIRGPHECGGGLSFSGLSEDPSRQIGDVLNVFLPHGSNDGHSRPSVAGHEVRGSEPAIAEKVSNPLRSRRGSMHLGTRVKRKHAQRNSIFGVHRPSDGCVCDLIARSNGVHLGIHQLAHGSG